MRDHPIPPVTEPLQYRAIGVVRGLYVPADAEQITRGLIRTEDGEDIEAVVLGRLLTLMRRHLDLTVPHLWVVYPRCREDGGLHLQMVGVWEPSTLATATAADATAADPTPADPTAADPTVADAEQAPAPGDDLPEGDGYFSARGELIFTRPDSAELALKVRQLPRPNGPRPTPFKLQLKGEIPPEHLRHFVALDLRRQGQELVVERYEVIAPVNERGSRGGKGRREGRRGSGSRPPARPEPSRGEPAASPPAPPGGAPARRAITRPSR